MITLKQSGMLVLIPIVLAFLVHLWNAGGFPPIHPDESAYLIKTMRVLTGYGVQNDIPLATDQIYTHPHFGQLFLAGTLAMTGYPNTLDLKPSEQSMSSLYAVPRFIMGLLAVLDTIIIYYIARRKFDTGVALVASSLFAVLPATLVLRQVFLDNIMLPFILLSILFALYNKPNNGKYHYILFSGISLGLAIYTKIPAFTMIPLVGYLIFINSKRINSVALWLVPVIVIPCLWPAYALSVGQFDLWIDGITAQASRQGEPNSSILDSLIRTLKIDPVILIIGILGLIYAAARKQYWIILWVVPFLIFSYFIGRVVPFHLVLIFPPLCISASLLLIQGFKFKLWRRLISPVLIFSIICFGLVVSMLLITLDVNSHQFKTQAVVVERLSDNNTVFVGRQVYSWIPRYVFHISFDEFSRESLPARWNESKILLVYNGMRQDSELRNDTKLILHFNRPILPEYYPYTGVTFNRAIWKQVDVRIN